ncbi:MAG: HD domain-containing protein [Phycisphaerae bacterium]|nr:HD domain-containing protein [Phycisphaerae bacterium]
MDSLDTANLRLSEASDRLELDAVLRICANLTSAKPLASMLADLVDEARAIIPCDAARFFLVEEAGDRRGRAASDDRPRIAFDRASSMALRGGAVALPDDNAERLAEHVATTGEPINILDAYRLPDDAPYRFDPALDLVHGYRTVSMLLSPMRDQHGRIVGVIQLVNRRDTNGDVVGFTSRDQQTLHALASAAAVAVRNVRLREDLDRANLDTVLRLATAAEVRDGETGQHIRRMSCYCEAVARASGQPLEWSRELLFASPMHDVGKLAVPDAILHKPGPLTPEERRVMQRHTSAGAEILAGSSNEVIRMAERIALTHHECWDGSGYPNGLAGDRIPLEGRIAAVADVFDALTNRRVYKQALSLETAYEMLVAQRGRQFDPRIIDAFVAARDEIVSIHDAYRDD